ncbi:TetR/AcrR family transcriptional regulator [Streptomyces otsuchiensis]|uniref:TetR/AcrR family transcriptional regulator n=1 Tax=Streptomyces otsuchiensis TaxID=2681388 RepID=UPI00102FBD75|nr:TetR/AcrR family transcriptional regulator [Streptomyces otsuchiensis]
MRQARAQRTHNDLLVAAAAVFDRMGYEKATLSLVSERAEVSRGALSFHFSHKADLADAVQRHACTSFARRLSSVGEGAQPALQTMVDMSHSALSLLTSDPVARAGMRLTNERDAPLDSAVHCRLALCEAFRSIAEQARDDLSLRSEVVPQPLAVLAVSLVSGAHAAHTDLAVAPHRWLADTWHLLLPSLAGEKCSWRFRTGTTPAREGAGVPPQASGSQT